MTENAPKSCRTSERWTRFDNGSCDCKGGRVRDYALSFPTGSASRWEPNAPNGWPPHQE